jgi:Uma2 family endonuclease
MTWDQICADPSLQNLPYKIETNEWGQIIMSPAKFWHSSRQGRISGILHSLAESGEVAIETAITTTKGVKVADVAWASSEFYHLHADEGALSAAPELCVEVLSESNSEVEMREKITLYFAHGAKEVWLCDEAGVMRFYVTPSQSAESSVLFPDFPASV